MIATFFGILVEVVVSICLQRVKIAQDVSWQDEHTCTHARSS
jgi:hypothetical protein